MPQGLKEGTAYMVAGFGASMAASFAAQVIASRGLGPEVYGLYGLVISNVALVSGFLDTGLAGAMATYVAERDAHQSKAGIISVVKAGIGVEFVLVALFVSLIWLFNKDVTRRFFSEIPLLALFFVIVVIVQALYGVVSGILQGLRELRAIAFIRLMQQISLLLFMVFFIIGLSWGLTAALSLHSLSLFLALGASVLFAHKILRKYPANKAEKDFADKGWTHLTRMIVQFSIPVSVVAVSSSWIQSSGPLIMNFLTNNKPGEQLGILVVMLTLARAFDTGLKTISRSAFPYLVNWNARGKAIKTRQYVNLMTLFVIGGYALVIAGSMLVGRPVVLLVFGKDYLAVADYLPVALLAFCAISLNDIYKISLFSLKVPGLFLIINILGLFVFVFVLMAGRYLLSVSDPIYLILVSMGIAYFAIFLGAMVLFRTMLKQRFQSSFSTLQT